MNGERTRLIGALALLFAANAARASSVGLLGGPASNGSATHSTGERELVTLVRSAGLLVGRPRSSTLRMIVIDAPADDTARMIVREVQHWSGRRSLVLTAPAALASQVRRVSLYLRPREAEFVVIESFGGMSVRHSPQRVSVASEAATGDGELANDADLLAVAASGLGPFWLVEDGEAAPGSAHSARALMGKDDARALLPTAAAVALLLLGRAVSLWAHRRDRRVG
jgi:hypothetical protein